MSRVCNEIMAHQNRVMQMPRFWRPLHSHPLFSSGAMTHIFVWLVLCLILDVRPAPTADFLPTDPKVRKVGRFQAQPDDSLRFDHPGTEIRLWISGATRIHFDLSQYFPSPAWNVQPHYFEMFVDGVKMMDGAEITYHSTSSVGQSESTSFTYTVLGLSGAASQTVVFYKSSEAQWNEESVGTNYMTMELIRLFPGWPPSAFQEVRIMLVISKPDIMASAFQGPWWWVRVVTADKATCHRLSGEIKRHSTQTQPRETADGTVWLNLSGLVY